MPDSTHIVFQAEFSATNRNHLWLADTKKERIQQITTTTTTEMDPSVSSDGQKIAFTSDNKHYDLVEIPLNGSEIKYLLSTGMDELDPAWSPSGQQFVYVTNRVGNKEIWIKNVQDGWERPLVTSKDFPKALTLNFFAPSFSADGQYISYSRHGDDGMGIWISPVIGGPPVKLTNGGQYSTWSPYGNYIAYIQGKKGDFSLYKVLVGSNDKPVLIRDHVYLNSPAWSPQGNWISCMVLEDGWILISPDGKTQKRITPEISFPIVHGWSKDGKRIYRLFVRNSTFYLNSVDADSLEIKTITLSTNFNWISGFSISPSGLSFASSVERGKSEIWLLERTDSEPANLFERIFRIFQFGTGS
jgi:Tol biopolymer transport system component